ncbi:CRISPR-associated endonuclease Cas1 [Phormidium pseudopriestleyi FRX01]|uniref:CRISPR-associated endonuclease Cas1 n=1 Tax=Phormidium pseudopriestleyi FRX01 TaxID=1759528 RepID=A0ABS3FPD8_9CYAN|nr:CRISPR-associated endonuclease Cas1 [Phormidium pseudopriestleyi]MBO0348913.1 CRISPR-associated endonuclease Cas1 [Phormidium pseudopriestleyi FRX01]
MTAIYLTHSGSILQAKRQVFELWHHQQLQRRVLAKMTSHIVLFHGCEITGEATALAFSHSLPVLFLDADGRYLGRLHLDSDTPYLTQQLQRAQDPEFIQNTAERIVSATLHNRRALLLSLQGSCLCPTVEIALEAIELFLDEIPAASLPQLRSHLATVNQIYYPALREWLWLNTLEPAMPVDNLWHLGQALLEQVGQGFLLEFGLDSNLGGLHLSDGENLPLVRDLTLDWTVILVDRLALQFFLSHTNLTHNGNGNGNGNGYHHPLDKFIAAWEQQLATLVTGNQTYRQCLRHQIRQYQRSLCHDISYRPALLKWTPKPIPTSSTASEPQAQSLLPVPVL